MPIEASHDGKAKERQSKVDKKTNQRFVTPIVTLLNGLLSLLLAIIVLDLPHSNFKTPFIRSGDSDFYVMISSNIRDSGWAVNNSHLGYPKGQHLNDFPQTADNLHILILKFLNIFTTDAMSVNIFYVLTFIFASTAMFFATKRLVKNNLIAIVVSQLFAFAPYHLIRGSNHLFLSGYYAIPLVLITLYFLTQKTNISYKEIIIVAIISASTGAYYGIFSLFTCLLCVLICFVNGGIKKNIYLKKSIIFGAVSAITFILNLLPSLLYIMKHGENTSVASRTPGETEIYGLQITDMFFPRTGHRIGTFARLAGKIHDTPVPSELGQALGIIASLSIILVGMLAFRSFFSDKKFPNELKFFSFTILAFTLIAVTSGFGLIISAVGLKDIRSWNRVSILIACCALFIFAIFLNNFKVWITKKYAKTSSKIFLVLILLVLAIGIFDQTSPLDKVSNKANQDAYISDCAYANKIESKVGKNKAVLQFPIIDFPEPKQAMNDRVYSGSILNSCDTSLYWSFGAMQGRDDSTNATILNAQEISSDEVIKKASELNFVGFDIDIQAQDSIDANFTKELIDKSESLPIYSDDKTRVFVVIGK